MLERLRCARGCIWRLRLTRPRLRLAVSGRRRRGQLVAELCDRLAGLFLGGGLRRDVLGHGLLPGELGLADRQIHGGPLRRRLRIARRLVAKPCLGLLERGGSLLTLHLCHRFEFTSRFGRLTANLGGGLRQLRGGFCRMVLGDRRTGLLDRGSRLGRRRLDRFGHLLGDRRHRLLLRLHRRRIERRLSGIRGGLLGRPRQFPLGGCGPLDHLSRPRQFGDLRRCLHPRGIRDGLIRLLPRRVGRRRLRGNFPELLHLSRQLVRRFRIGRHGRRLREPVGDLGEAAEHLALLGDGLPRVSLKKFLGGGDRGLLRLLHERSHVRSGRGHIVELVEILSQFRLLLDKCLDRGIGGRGLGDLRAEFFPLPLHVTNSGDRRVGPGCGSALRLLDPLLERGEKVEHLPLRGGCRGKVGGGQPLLCRCQDGLGLAVAESAQRLGCGGTDRTLPGTDVLERRDEHAVERTGRPLLFKRGERDGLTPAGQLLRQRLGRLEHRRLLSGQPPHLRGDVGHLQATEQHLPLGRKPDRDVADQTPRLLNGLSLIGGLRRLGLREQVHHSLHLVPHEAFNVAPHRLDLGMERQLLEAVVLQLPQLDVERGGDEFAGHRTGPFLGVAAGERGPRRGRRRIGRMGRRPDDDEEATHGKKPAAEATGYRLPVLHVLIHDTGRCHRVPPTPSWRSMIVSSCLAERSSVSESAARMPDSSVMSSTIGSLDDVCPLPGPR